MSLFFGSFDENRLPISPNAAAPKRESIRAWIITSPSEYASKAYSHLIKTPPRNIPFPGMSLWASYPIPTLKLTLHSSLRRKY